MKRLFPLVLLALTACGPIKPPLKDAHAACMTKVTPPAQFADVSDKERRYLILCMSQKGYAFDDLLGDCNRQMAPTTLVRCYKAADQK